MIGLARLAGPIACAGLAILLLARTRNNRIAGLCYAGVGGVLLIAAVAKPLALGAAIVGLAVAAPAVGWILRREPWLVAYLALATLPIRVHVLGNQLNSKSTGGLLVPLYLVAAGAGFNLLWEFWHGDVRAREFGRATKPLALFLLWIGISMTWTDDPRTGAVQLIAFFLPFTILALSIARLPWEPRRIKLLYGELVAMAAIFAGVGLYEYETKHIFQNAKLNVGNTYSAVFRVNSIFYDPSVYGRFLVVALVATAVLIVRGKSVRNSLLALAFTVFAWFGLLVSFSQSSFAALFVAIFCLGVFVWRGGKGIVVVAVAVVVLTGGVVAAAKLVPSLRHQAGVAEINSLSSGRGSLIYNGLRIAKRHPVNGVGLGGFSAAYSHLTHRSDKQSASHNTPVTVAAEGGFIGLALFLWLVIAFGMSALRRVDQTLSGSVALAAGLILVAIFVHANAYSDFFEDPTMWIVFGLIGLAATRRRSAMMEP
jgi:putative inorganic carbon (HCO3(-)) transporter